MSSGFVWQETVLVVCQNWPVCIAIHLFIYSGPAARIWQQNICRICSRAIVLALLLPTIAHGCTTSIFFLELCYFGFSSCCTNKKCQICLTFCLCVVYHNGFIYVFFMQLNSFLFQRYKRWFDIDVWIFTKKKLIFRANCFTWLYIKKLGHRFKWFYVILEYQNKGRMKVNLSLKPSFIWGERLILCHKPFHNNEKKSFKGSNQIQNYQ